MNTERPPILETFNQRSADGTQRSADGMQRSADGTPGENHVEYLYTCSLRFSHARS